MTDFLIAGRGAGKTHRLLEMMLDDPEVVYVAHSAAAADWALDQFLRQAEVRGFDIDGDFIRRSRLRFVRFIQAGRHPKKVVVDNVELLLSRMLNADEVVTITGTGITTELPTPFTATKGTPE